MVTLYKVFAHDLSSPIQGTPAPAGFENGQVPFTLPTVEVDTSDNECGRGWNACRKASEALTIVGIWYKGKSRRLFKVEVDEAVAIERGHKVRFPTGTIVEEITDFTDAITELCEPFDESIRAGLVNEIKLWQRAFQPRAESFVPDCDKIESLLREALDYRGLADWTVKKFDSKQAAYSTWLNWDPLDSWNAWDLSKKRGNVVLDLYCRAWASLESQASANAYYALDNYVHGDDDPRFLTVGIRDAHQEGMQGTMVTGDKELGYWISPD